MIDDRELAMRPREAKLPEQMRVIHAMLDVRLRPFIEERKFRGAYPVRDHAYMHAAPGRVHQCSGNGVARCVVAEDVGLERDLVLRGVDAFNQRREKFHAGFEQPHRIVDGEAQP